MPFASITAWRLAKMTPTSGNLLISQSLNFQRPMQKTPPSGKGKKETGCAQLILNTTRIMVGYELTPLVGQNALAATRTRAHGFGGQCSIH